ncbi:glycosyltransferase family 2 protein [Streptococcus agalactiae]|uniref:glycosyltransferase family 2 protein n=1 Tax=Streptococcus agalactiae TaxID=1311 RepID=UPI00035F9C89|nr:glycosyltransferase family 2 protein [Streptococcus agalactiae]EPX11381.1 hypothetical protein SAG0165_11840 [Streptococcus agalactiae MRI Z1-217]
MEKISIIIPVYNVKKYLNDCIQSVINQTYNNLEIILIDDGSTDGSGDYCDEIAKKDSRIFVYHKTNGGLSEARNVGIKISTGKYITFIDSDDYIENLYIETLYNSLIEYKADMSLSIILCKHSSKADIVNQIGFQVCPYIGQNLCGFVVLA